MLGSSPSAHAIHSPSLPPGASYVITIFTSVPRLRVGRNSTTPEFGMSEPSSDFHPIRSFVISLVTSASHSTVWPSGAFATQCEVFSSVTVTDSRWRIKIGRFPKFRQNVYSSAADLLIVKAFVTWTLPEKRAARVKGDF